MGLNVHTRSIYSARSLGESDTLVFRFVGKIKLATKASHFYPAPSFFLPANFVFPNCASFPFRENLERFVVGNVKREFRNKL